MSVSTSQIINQIHATALPMADDESSGCIGLDVNRKQIPGWYSEIKVSTWRMTGMMMT